MSTATSPIVAPTERDATTVPGHEEPTAEQPENQAPPPEPAHPEQIGALVPLLGLVALIVTASWWMLHQWYGLLENRDNTHFSFEKIQGWWDNPVIRQTALVFLVLTACFAATITILRALPALPVGGKLALLAMTGGAALINIYLYPIGALDVFNYMIELKLAYHFDENPYITTFEQYRDDPYALPAFLVTITLFYGPAWLLVMWVPTAFSGFSDVIDTLIALKVFNVALIALTGYLIARYQRDSRVAWVAAALFVANPLVMFEGVANGHNDVLLTVFIAGALLALSRRSPLAGPLLALSALVKLYTVALVPIFIVVALKGRWSWKRIAVTVALTAVTVVVTCAPFWGDGELVDGLRAGLEESQEMDHVSPLSLTRQYAQEREAQDSGDPAYVRSRPSFEIVPAETQDRIRAGFTIAFAVAALLIATTVWMGRPPELAVAETLMLLFLMMTNLYPWYPIAIVAVLALRPDRLSRDYIVIASGLGLLYYIGFVYGHFNSGWTRFEVHQFLALFLTAPILLYLLARALTWRSDHEQDATAT